MTNPFFAHSFFYVIPVESHSAPFVSALVLPSTQASTSLVGASSPAINATARTPQRQNPETILSHTADRATQQTEAIRAAAERKATEQKQQIEEPARVEVVSCAAFSTPVTDEPLSPPSFCHQPLLPLSRRGGRADLGDSLLFDKLGLNLLQLILHDSKLGPKQNYSTTLLTTPHTYPSFNTSTTSARQYPAPQSPEEAWLEIGGCCGYWGSGTGGPAASKRHDIIQSPVLFCKHPSAAHAFLSTMTYGYRILLGRLYLYHMSKSSQGVSSDKNIAPIR
ncbi:hypothetical protein V494_08287 [Pseudogymnoascus sp. VKM F-4513 (FW-928)]|nr:hypothetical protein V494_08287 [Pseudogymnoascus sp. VKM F-4513 (FW-928)]